MQCLYHSELQFRSGNCGCKNFMQQTEIKMQSVICLLRRVQLVCAASLSLQ